MPSKSKKYSRKRNYRKRRHSRRMQRKSRSRNAYAYNRRRRAMFGGAPEGKYNVTADTSESSDDKTSLQNSMNETVLELLKSMGYLDDSHVSTDQFNNHFKTESIKIVKLYEKDYTVTLTPDDDNYKVNVKVKPTSEQDTGIDGNVTFTKVPA
jgi:hypothetical protein